MRAFLALPILPPALSPYLAWRAQLATELDAVRWAPADSPHVTIHFFGSVTEHDAERALAALRPVLEATPAPRLRLSGVGSFPSARRPRVLWCGVAGDIEALAACAVACIAALREAGFPVDERPYRPHCTVGRPRLPWPAAAMRRWEQIPAGQPHTPAFTADHGVLYESVTAACGTRHVPRVTLPLALGRTPT